MYDEVLARIHSAAFTELAEAAARMVHDVCPTGAVADLGCGDGTLLAALARRGHAVWGCDVSAAMVQLARRRVPHAVHADARTAAIPPSQVVCAVGEVCSFAALAGDAVLTDLFRRVHAALRPGGIFLFDVASTGRACPPTRAERRGRHWRIVADAHEEGDMLVRQIDAWWQDQHVREVHRLRLLPSGWVVPALEAAGFQVETLGGYDDHGFIPGWDGYLATKGGEKREKGSAT